MSGSCPDRRLPDLLVAAVAERERVTVRHCDGDYDLIAKITGRDRSRTTLGRLAAQWLTPQSVRHICDREPPAVTTATVAPRENDRVRGRREAPAGRGTRSVAEGHGHG
jgi:hypothetical protein